MLLSPIHCCDVTKPPYLLSDELCTSPLHSNRLYVFTVCCRRGGQCFSVLRERHTDVVGDSSGRSYVTRGLENELCCISLYLWALLILQPFRRFTYITAHSPTLPLLHLRYSSFSNPSFACATSQALHLIHLVSRPCPAVRGEHLTAWTRRPHGVCTPPTNNRWPGL